jgi:hypothetical protein
MTVIVQAGHVARTTGSTGTGGEQEFNLAVANMVAAEVKRRGGTAKVIRADVAQSDYRGDYFVAIHADGSTSKSVRGSSVGYRNARGKTLALAIKKHYQERAKQAGYALSFRADNYTPALHHYYGTGYAIAQNPSCRAVIVEGGFLTHPLERTFLSTQAGRRALALGIADAILPDRPSVPAPTVAVKPYVNAASVLVAFKRRGDDVNNDTEQVQRALNARYGLKLRTDGIVDDETVAAYKHHQLADRRTGKDADGMPGPTVAAPARVPHQVTWPLHRYWTNTKESPTMFTAAFWKATGERAVRAAAATLLSFAGSDVVDAFHVDYERAAGVSIGSAGVTVLICLIAGKVTSTDGPAFQAEKLAPPAA